MKEELFIINQCHLPKGKLRGAERQYRILLVFHGCLIRPCRRNRPGRLRRLCLLL